MIENLTIIYYTPNYEDETFADTVRKFLLKTIGDTPLISVSHSPIKFGHNICVGDIGRSARNVYKQMLIGCKEAKTDYVAMAEDDTFYHPSHFDSIYLPPLDTFAYNMARWSVCTWVRPPVYSFVGSWCNSNLIAPRKLLVELLEKRFATYPHIEKTNLWNEPGKFDDKWKLGTYKTLEFATTPTISFVQPESLGYGFLGTRKRIHPIRAFDIPYWGHVNNMIKMYESN